MKTIRLILILLLSTVLLLSDSSKPQLASAMPTVSCSAVTEITPGDCAALQAFYNTTSGGSWGNWFSTSTPCSTPWTGITCSGGRVVGLVVYELNISGTIPPELGNLSELTNLQININQLTGAIPAELGNLKKVQYLYLDKNQLTGSIPSSFGGLDNIYQLTFGYNQMSGEIPSTLTNLGDTISLLRVRYNMLSASDSSLISFLNNLDDQWRITQTVPPTGLQASVQSTTSIQVSWAPIQYTENGGYYQVSYGTTSTASGNTRNTRSKSDSGLLINGLSPDTVYYFKVRTYTPAHDSQQNDLWSDYSEIVREPTPTSCAADFAAAPTSGPAPLSVQFADRSTGSYTTWLWSFGDGSSESSQNPSHTYTSPGAYTVSLQISGSGCSNTKTTSNYIKIPPHAEFSGSQTTGPAPLSVQFTDQSTGSNTNWYWSFGDGGSSTEQNPAHTYNGAGSYTVSLKVNGPGGSDTKTKSDYIWVNSTPPPPVANFSMNPISAALPVTVNFINQSTGTYNSCSWSFGDGGASEQCNPSHTYSSPGSYTVSLAVSGPGGSNTKNIPDYIQIPPDANFSATPERGPADLAVHFSDLSNGNNTGWSWSFGDGNTDTARNPSHTYKNPGSYTVSLTVTGPGGSDIETKNGYITVDPPPPIRFVFFPPLLKNLEYGCPSSGLYEKEDNDSFGQAIPIGFGQDIYGHANDTDDYFSVDLPTTATLVIDLVNPVGDGTQLIVYYQNVYVDRAFKYPFHLEFPNRPAGRYNIRFYTAPSYLQNSCYKLRVSYH